MTIVRNLLESKGGHVWSIDPEATVFDAITLMAEKGIGALVVMSGDQVVGMLSERDYARKVLLKGRASRTTPVRDIMSQEVVFAAPDQNVEQCMNIMTDKRIRHLPVLDDGKVVGLVSIGDLVKAIITEQQETIEHLESYIRG